MQINHDCLRAVLLCVEEHTSIRAVCSFVDEFSMKKAGLAARPLPVPDYQQELEKTYDSDTLIYHVRYCADAGLVYRVESAPAYSYIISDLTPAGHELVGKIRDPDRWSDTKGKMSRIGDFSLSALSAIVEGATSAILKCLISS